ncbi:MAG TPA: hypothetical protein V6D47_14370, partial [Oscillatoriaceae cyanobacterium]
APSQPAWRVLTAPRAPKRRVPRSWAIALGALLLSTLALYVHTVAQEAHLERLQVDLRRLHDENIARRSELASIQNPARIAQQATTALGMQEPKEVVFLNKPVSELKAAPDNVIPPPPAVVHEGF